MSVQTMDVQKILAAYLLENSSVVVSGEISPDENLLDGGILDSLGIAELTEFIEKEFGIEVDEDEVSAKNYRSVQTLTQFCTSKIAERTA